jgi:hypothetical protein
MKVIKNGEKVEMTYDEVCKDLGYLPETKFIKVTPQGRISFTLGKPNEIKGLYHSINEKGYLMSDKLKETLNTL